MENNTTCTINCPW